MNFLIPVGGIIDDRFYGIMTSPGHKGVPIGIKNGMCWAGENEKFTRGWQPNRFFSWLEEMKPYRDKCIFIPCPDVVGDAIRTGAWWRKWSVPLLLDGWPLAFVAQDGQEYLPLPHPSVFSTLFIGGTTEWKESQEAISCIKRAQSIGKHIHIGRVNAGRRYRLFSQIRGSESFTCDGTRTRYDGREKTLDIWAALQDETNMLKIW